MSFVWRDVDGSHYGWRWHAPEPPASIQVGRSDMDYLFTEDLSERDPSGPDANGIRWLGARPHDWDNDRT